MQNDNPFCDFSTFHIKLDKKIRYMFKKVMFIQVKEGAIVGTT